MDRTWTKKGYSQLLTQYPYIKRRYMENNIVK